MPKKPQYPPEVEASVLTAAAVCRPTSPPPPRKSEPMSDLDAMRHNWKSAVDQNGRIRKVCESLRKELEHMRKQLSKHQCPDCGETDRKLKQGLDPMSGEPVCFECGGSWE